MNNNLIADIGNYVLEEDLAAFIRNTFNQDGNLIEQINQADVAADEEERRINREIVIEENEERQMEMVVEPMPMVDDDDDGDYEDEEELPPLIPDDDGLIINPNIHNNRNLQAITIGDLFGRLVNPLNNTFEFTPYNIRVNKNHEIFKLNEVEIKLTETTLEEICDGKFDNKIITNAMTKKEQYKIKCDLITAYFNYTLYDCSGSMPNNINYILLLDKSTSNYGNSTQYYDEYKTFALKTTGIVNLNSIDIKYINDKYANIINNLERKETILFKQLQDMITRYHPELFTLNDFSMNEILEIKQILQDKTLANAGLYNFIDKYIDAFIHYNYLLMSNKFLNTSCSFAILNGNMFSRNIMKLSTFALYVEELLFHKSYIISEMYKRTKDERKELKPLYLKYVNGEKINGYDNKIKKMSNIDMNNMICNFDKYEEIINSYIPYESLFKTVDNKVVIDYTDFMEQGYEFLTVNVNIHRYYNLLKLNYDILEYERMINVIYNNQTIFMNEYISKNWTKMVEIKPFHQIENKFNDNNCLICLQEFTKDVKVVKLHCGHLYEKECIAKWIKDSKSLKCPTCADEHI